MTEDTERPAGPPAGWYPSQTDPTTEVYWDGSAWTGQARQRGQVPPPPPRDGSNPQTGTRQYAWGTGEYAGKYWDGKKWVTPGTGKVIAPTTSLSPAPKRKFDVKALVYLILIGVLVALVAAYCSNTTSSGGGGGTTNPNTNTQPDQTMIEIGAWDVCKQQVESMLKAPATAGFPMMSEFTPTHSGNVYTIKAWVDAENGFGANIRTYFTCKATHTGGDNYRVNVQLQE